MNTPALYIQCICTIVQAAHSDLLRAKRHGFGGSYNISILPSYFLELQLHLTYSDATFSGQ